MEMCVLYIVYNCLLFNVYCANVYIVHFSYIVACTAMAQSLVPKNFTISTLVYMMCDNKEIWFDVIALDQKISNQASHAFKYEGLLSNEIRFMLSVFSTAKVCVFFQQKLKSPITPVLLSTPAKLNGPRPNGAYWLRRHMTFLNEQLGRGHRWIMFGGVSFTHCWYKIPSSVNSVNCFMQNSKLCISLMFLKLRYERFLGVKSEQNVIPEQVHEIISVLWYSVVRYSNDILGALERFGSEFPGNFRDILFIIAWLHHVHKCR